MTNNTIPVITIDGPSGVGKGSVSLRLANQLHWHTLDSGALYRLLAWAAHSRHLPLTDELALATLAEQLSVQFQILPNLSGIQVFSEGQDVSLALRTETCAAAASQLAILSKVRQALLTRQRAFRQRPGLIAEGRDMGTVVFPDAPIKIFLTASSEERAKRRYKQLKEKGVNVKLATLLTEIKERDKRDSERTVAPLTIPENAWVIDTTEVALEAVVERISQRVSTYLAGLHSQ
jgi:cytidylate kinase